MNASLAVARRHMIESQVRTWGVLNDRVLDLLARAPRDAFVPEAWHNRAYMDLNIPIGHGQSMMTPTLEGRLLQTLEIAPGDRLLEVGTGSGFLTWCLAQLGDAVTSVEIVPELSAAAGARLAALGVNNVRLEVGDAAQGWPKGAPYDAILVTGSLPVLPPDLQESLAPGGRLVVIVGRAPVMEARLIRRLDHGCSSQSLFETSLPPLQNAPQGERFLF